MRFRVESGNFSAVSNPTGSAPFDPGEAEITLAPSAKVGRWAVSVLDNGGNPVSQPIEVETNTDNCGPGGSGKQIVTVLYTKFR